MTFKASTKRSVDDVRGPVLAHFKKTQRPVLIGHIATELKTSLADAEHYLQALSEEGLIRELTTQEKITFGYVHGYLAA